jgi:hypothetical protein
MASPALNSEMPRLDSFLWSAADSAPNLGSLVEVVRNGLGSAHDPVTVETLIADDAAPMVTLAEGRSDTELRTVGLVSLLRVYDDDGSFVVSAWPTAYDGVFHIVGSVPSTDGRWQRVERWIGRSAPELVPCFLNHSDFSDIGTALSEHGDVEVSRLTARRQADISSLTRGWPARSATLRPNHLDAISAAEAEGASVRTLTLQVSDGDEHVLSVHLRRLAGATFYGGSFKKFDNIVLSRLASAAHQRAQLLRGRNRVVDAPLAQPITIHLRGAVLVDAEATGDVLAELEKGTALAVAVLHRNPYMHAVVTANSDGSNFDVVVTSPDVIHIYPGFRASLGALALLTQRLGERFEALEISEAQAEQPISLDDMVMGI